MNSFRTFLRCAISIKNCRQKGTASSNIWLERQRRDPYVKRAVKESYRARSAFKLLEINDKFKFINHGDCVIDCGACPGSWSQVAVQLTNSNAQEPTNPKGLVIALDREFIIPIQGAHVLSYTDITEKKTEHKIEQILGERKANSVISDMAPNSTGQSTFDHDSIIELQLKAFDLAQRFLQVDGYFLCKIWFGDRTNQFMNQLSAHFKSVRIVKPKASRNDSAEVFILCFNYKPQIK